MDSASSPKEHIASDEVAAEAAAAIPVSSYRSLPRSGSSSRHVWNSFYWPLLNKGILARYYSRDSSPLEKFEKAYGAHFEAMTSRYTRGKLAEWSRRDLPSSPLGWFGLCHGSAVAPTQFPEPLVPVEVNGVVFTPFEIKGLLSYAMTEAPPSGSRFWGRRSEADRVIEGARSQDPLTRDINPGLFHKVLGNVMGRNQKQVVLDLVSGEVVLNFPVRSYEFREIGSAWDEWRLRRSPGVSSDAETLVKIEASLSLVDNHRVVEQKPGTLFTFEKTYEYVLELDEDGEIIGGEWLGSSRDDHPDFAYVQVPLDPRSLMLYGVPVGMALDELARKSNDTSRPLTPAERKAAEAIRPHQEQPVVRSVLEDFEDMVPAPRLTSPNG